MTTMWQNTYIKKGPCLVVHVFVLPNGNCKNKRICFHTKISTPE